MYVCMHIYVCVFVFEYILTLHQRSKTVTYARILTPGIVRLKRDRYEQAQAISSYVLAKGADKSTGTTGETAVVDFCDALEYRFCPSDRPDDVMLKPPEVCVRLDVL
jgi:hypothetical protein